MISRAPGSNRLAAFAVLVAMLGGCATLPAAVDALIVVVDAEPPALRARCGGDDALSDGWLVFTVAGCAHCRRLIDDLAAIGDPPGAIAVVDAPDCASARATARTGSAWTTGTTITRATLREAAAWGVDAFPTSFLLREGRVVVALRGHPGRDGLRAIRDDSGARSLRRARVRLSPLPGWPIEDRSDQRAAGFVAPRLLDPIDVPAAGWWPLPAALDLGHRRRPTVQASETRCLAAPASTPPAAQRGSRCGRPSRAAPPRP